MEGDHWRGQNCSHDEYTSIVNHSFPLINNALYSESGKWGILISHEFHAIIGCTKEFWEEFEKHYPQWRKDYHDFIAYWEHEKEIWPKIQLEWLPKLLDGLTVKP